MQCDEAAPSRPGSGLAWAGLAATILLAFYPSLWDGLTLDDHWHQRALTERGWSPSDLVESTTIDPRQLVELWWQDRPVQWRYVRPVSVALMKGVEAVAGGRPAAHHVVSLLLHLLCAGLVFQLAFRVTGNRFWSLIGGLLFAIYPHAVFAASWRASQNALLQTALTVGAVLCYVRASGLRLRFDAPVPEAVPPWRMGSLCAAVVLWVFAVFSRETAVVLPAFLLALDLAFGGRRHVWSRRTVHIGLFALALGYVAWRVTCFEPLPGVYMRRPDGFEYVPWLAAKLLHYVCCSIWFAPMMLGPTGRDNPWIEVPGDMLLMAGIVVVIGAAYVLATRRVRGHWIWPVWIVLFVMPVTPILATPHAGYVCGVGFAIAAVLAPATRRRMPSSLAARVSPFVVGVYVMLSLVFVVLNRLQWQAMIAAERVTVAKLAGAPPNESTTEVFFINLPFVNIYAKLDLPRTWGNAIDDPTFHVLTFAPDLVRVEDRCIVRQLDDHRFSVTIDGRPYFSGLLGRVLIEPFRHGGRLRTGEIVRGERFDAEVAEADERGVRSIVFSFHKPLHSPEHAFYLTTRACPAARIPFRSMRDDGQPLPPIDGPFDAQAIAFAVERLDRGESSAAEVLFAAVQSSPDPYRRAAEAALHRVAGFLAEALGDPIQRMLASESLTSSDWDATRRWWHRHVDDDLLHELWVRRHELDNLIEIREEVHSARRFAARHILRTDLYLTGPPYRGPR